MPAVNNAQLYSNIQNVALFGLLLLPSKPVLYCHSHDTTLMYCCSHKFTPKFLMHAESMFELTDLWCDSVDINEYMLFTKDMHNLIEEWQEEENPPSDGTFGTLHTPLLASAHTLLLSLFNFCQSNNQYFRFLSPNCQIKNRHPSPHPNLTRDLNLPPRTAHHHHRSLTVCRFKLRACRLWCLNHLNHCK